MNNTNDLTTGNVATRLVRFALPYLLAAFMQTLYGLADLFVVGLYNDSSTTTAVSIGSQIMHMLTVIVLGIAMGTTVLIGRSVGAKDEKQASKVAGNSICLFGVIAIILTLVLLVSAKPIVRIMLTPEEAVSQTTAYLRVCFVGVPFIIMYNVISSIFRGAGDSRHPMVFVAIACVVNIIIDFAFIGGLGLGAVGAALGTIIGQAVSVFVSLIWVRKINLGFKVRKSDIRWQSRIVREILGVGAPIALQDGFIQVAFIVITIIANNRGLVAATGVGITEKIICFLFLVPSSFLSAISAVTAQNIGANKPARARATLLYGLLITCSWGIICALYCQFLPETLVGLFTRDSLALAAGCAYLRSYSVDTFFASIHFCFSGYFCGIQKSIISFVHNIISITFLRIPLSYLFSKTWPDTLYPMGFAAPIGSIFSALVCIGVYIWMRNRKTIADK